MVQEKFKNENCFCSDIFFFFCFMTEKNKGMYTGWNKECKKERKRGVSRVILEGFHREYPREIQRGSKRK